MNIDKLQWRKTPIATLRIAAWDQSFMLKSNQENLKMHLYIFSRRKGRITGIYRVS